MVIGITNDTMVKEQTDEQTWLKRYGWVFDEIAASVDQHGGTVVKYLSDGALVAFDEGRAADAINAAIGLNETLTENYIGNEMSCSVGIASGEVVAFDDAQGHTDYIGTTVDRASKLSGSASAKAVWVDRETIDIANMRQVRSALGSTLDRSVGDYQGEPQKILLPGLGTTTYHEVVWSQTPFGVKSTTVTEALAERAAAPPRRPSAPPPHVDRLRGELAHWNESKQVGVITSEEGEQYFVGVRNLVGDFAPVQGTTVWFVPLPAKREGDNPIAGCTVALGSRAHGYVAKIIDGKPFGFIEVEDDFGNIQELFWYFGDDTTGLQPDDPVDFLVDQNDRGPQCKEVTAAADMDVA